MNEVPVYRTPEGHDRALGRDTDVTTANWDRIAASMPIAPRTFQGALDRSPNIRRFHHASFLSQRQRGYCTAFNWTGTVMTRLCIPEGATPTSGTKLATVRLSPLYTYDTGRAECTAEGFNMGWGDGLIGSAVSRGSEKQGVVPFDVYPSNPADIDNHRNGTKTTAASQKAGALHLVKQVAYAESFDHWLELASVGHPTAFASSIPSGMMQTAADGRFNMSGSVVGGHEYQVLDFDKSEDKIWVAQAWEYWGAKSADPLYAAMHGYTQIGYTSLTDMEKWFSARAMASGSSEIMVCTTVDGFAPPIANYDVL